MTGGHVCHGLNRTDSGRTTCNYTVPASGRCQVELNTALAPGHCNHYSLFSHVRVASLNGL